MNLQFLTKPILILTTKDGNEAVGPCFFCRRRLARFLCGLSGEEDEEDSRSDGRTDSDQRARRAPMPKCPQSHILSHNVFGHKLRCFSATKTTIGKVAQVKIYIMFLIHKLCSFAVNAVSRDSRNLSTSEMTVVSFCQSQREYGTTNLIAWP